ncbi:MAG: thiamine phosphate synthase [Solirubrobacteraceae bacterium]|jgi:thiamine-phosphate pyrophosphorylase
MSPRDLGAERRERLAAARLYLVCDSSPGAGELPDMLRGAVAGGIDIFQLRDKHLPDDELTAVANATRALCERLGPPSPLLVVNDRPHIALDVGADGIHVGQDDMPVTEARALVGADMLIGLSTHSPEQIDAVDASLVDYIGVGPIHATPTKPGRPAVGIELIHYAADHAPVPFFAIGGLGADNLADALDAGAQRVCVLRAIADAAEPQRAARELRDIIDARPMDGSR